MFFENNKGDPKLINKFSELIKNGTDLSGYSMTVSQCIIYVSEKDKNIIITSSKKNLEKLVGKKLKI